MDSKTVGYTRRMFRLMVINKLKLLLYILFDFRFNFPSGKTK